MPKQVKPTSNPELIVCLDLATTFGWATYTVANETVMSGSIELKEKSHGSKYKELYDKIYSMIECDMVVHVYCEQPFARGSGTKLLMGFLAIAEMVCYDTRKTFKGIIPPKSIKSFVMSGSAGKDDMIAVAKRLFPDQTIIDDNQADALCLLAWVRKH